jgi:hypothetical protein
MITHNPAPEPDPAADQRAEDAQYYRRVLHELIDVGVAVARRIHQQVVESATPAYFDEATPPLPDVTHALERVSRTIRRSILLAMKVAEPVAAPDSAAQVQKRVAARKQIIREVEDTMERTGREQEGSALHAELLERLDSPDLDDAIDTRPLPEIIDEMRHDLGLIGGPDSHYWKRRTPEDIAVLNARAAAPRGTARMVPARTPGAATGGDRPADAAADAWDLRRTARVSPDDG